MEIIRLQDGRELSYTVFGVRNPEPGRTIIYFHGFMSSRLEAAMLQDRALDLGIRIVAADRSGYGDSTYDPHRTPHSAVKDVEQLLEALLPPDEKVVFYGVSGKAFNLWNNGGTFYQIYTFFLTNNLINYSVCRWISLCSSLCCFTTE